MRLRFVSVYSHWMQRCIPIRAARVITCSSRFEGILSKKLYRYCQNLMIGSAPITKGGIRTAEKRATRVFVEFLLFYVPLSCNIIWLPPSRHRISIHLLILEGEAELTDI